VRRIKRETHKSKSKLLDFALVIILDNFAGLNLVRTSSIFSEYLIFVCSYNII
jgi:hypothetical protein